MSGWITLHRKLLDWQWYNEPNTLRVFLHLLLKANYKPKKWQGTTINAGQLITGRLKLAEELNLSEMQIRTVLNRLKSTNEITIKTTSQYSIISINNWLEYQQDNQQDNQQITNEQPTDNQQITTTEQKNKENKENKELLTVNCSGSDSNSGSSLDLIDEKEFLKLVLLAMEKPMTEETAKSYVNKKIGQLQKHINDGKEVKKSNYALVFGWIKKDLKQSKENFEQSRTENTQYRYKEVDTSKLY